MLFDKNALFEFLEIIDESLAKKITLVAAGGTAMTLLDLKTSTLDIDFTLLNGSPMHGAILDAGWGKFGRLRRYKAERAGKPT